MPTLAELSTPDADGNLQVPDAWRHGRGTFGGLTIAAAIRAIERRVADPRRVVRTVTAELPGPTMPGVPARFDVDILRSGSSLTVARAALRQGNDITTHAVAVLGAARAKAGAPAWRELAPPSAAPWRSVAAAPFAPGAPEFTQHFEYRVAAGVPFSGGEPLTIGWVRPRDPGDLRDAAYVAAVMDAWYPASLVRATAMFYLATVSYTLELVDGCAGLAADAPLLYRGRVAIAGDGFVLETRELWGEDGRLVAINHQTFAVLG